MATTLYHWKSGEIFEGNSGRFSDVTNPASGEVTAQLALASEDDVNDNDHSMSSAAVPGDAPRNWRSSAFTGVVPTNVPTGLV